MNDQQTQSAQRVARSTPPHGSAKWLVWSNEHRAYWRPNMAGYTTFAKAAGRYTEAQAIEICRDARSHGDDGTPPPETMIREDCISPNAEVI